MPPENLDLKGGLQLQKRALLKTDGVWCEGNKEKLTVLRQAGLHFIDFLQIRETNLFKKEINFQENA